MILAPYYQGHGLDQSISLKQMPEFGLTRFSQSYGLLEVL